MQKSTTTLHKITLGNLSLFISIFVIAIIIISHFLFWVYIAVYKVEAVGIYKSTIPVVSCLGIVLGIFGLQNKDKSRPLLKVNPFSSIGILLNIGLLISALIIDVPRIIGTITKIDTYNKNSSDLSILVDLDLNTNKSVKHIFDDSPKPTLIVYISKDTPIYKQVGYWSWQKIKVEMPQFQIYQLVEVKYDGLILTSYPGQISAIEAIILNH